MKLRLARGAGGGEVDISERLAILGVPGVSFAAFGGGEISLAYAAGVRRHGLPDAVTPETLFQAGSISKLVAAVTALRLVDAGLVDLDQGVNERLASWKVPANDGWQPAITLRQLLSHTAGTSVHGFSGYRPDEPIPNFDQILAGQPPARNPAIRVDVLPGTVFRYSGGGFMVVQKLIEEVFGKDFENIVREQVFEPLGMSHSTFRQPMPVDLAGRAASGHWYRSDVAATGAYVHPEQAAAGLWSTPSDLARLMMAIHASSRGETSFLSRHLCRDMLTPQGVSPAGLGVFFEGEGPERRFGHSGDTFGFLADATCFFQSGQGAAVMCNSITGFALMQDVLRTLAERFSWPALDVTRKAMPGTVPVVTLGSYVLASGQTVTLGGTSDKPALHYESQPPVPLFPSAPARYSAIVLDLDLQVEGPSSVTICQGDSRLSGRLARN